LALAGPASVTAAVIAIAPNPSMRLTDFIMVSFPLADGF
jgi:hypothetical protein